MANVHQIKNSVVVSSFAKLRRLNKLGGIFDVLFGGYPSANTKQNLSIHNISGKGRSTVKKIAAYVTVLFTMKAEIQSLYNAPCLSIWISYFQDLD